MYKTIREVYIDILIELVREESPTLYIEDFVYYYNKAINEYVKKRYELFEMTQQLSDDLRFWKKKHTSSSLIIPIDSIGISNDFKYRHLLNCLVSVSTVFPDIDCDQTPGSTFTYKATRFTSSIKAGLMDNAFLKPKYYRPYFDIIDNNIEIHMGEAKAGVTMEGITIEYLKQPAKVDITESQVRETADTSQVLEFTDDVGDEISKIALMLIFERGQSPRTQSNSVVNQSVLDSSVRGGQK